MRVAQKNKTYKSLRKIMIFLLLVIFSSILSISIISIFARPSLCELYKYNYIGVESDVTNYSDKDLEYIRYLTNRNRIIPVSLIYESTMAYYDTLITILLSSFAALSFFSWMSVKNKVSIEVKEGLSHEIESKGFSDDINAKIESIVASKMDVILPNIRDELRDGIPSLVTDITNKAIESKIDRISDISRMEDNQKLDEERI